MRRHLATARRWNASAMRSESGAERPWSRARTDVARLSAGAHPLPAPSARAPARAGGAEADREAPGRVARARTTRRRRRGIAAIEHAAMPGEQRESTAPRANLRRMVLGVNSLSPADLDSLREL